MPNGQNVAMFEEEGEISADLNLTTGGEHSGMQFQAAGALTDHLAFQFNSFAWNAIEGSTGYLIEFAPGYFTQMGNNFIFETFVGFGQGESYPRVGQILPLGELTPNDVFYYRYFVQPAIGYVNNNMELVFSTRLSALDFRNQNPVYVVPERNELDIRTIGEMYTVDPALTLRFGSRSVKFHVQYVYCLVVDEKIRKYSIYDNSNLNIGLHLNFHKLWGHRNKSMPVR